MADVKYTVVKGDTLSKIAATYDTTVAKLVSLNNISNPDYIVVGQVLIISGDTATVSTNATSNQAKIEVFGLQSNTDRTVYATWSWDKSNTENYEVKWMYATGDGVGFIGSKTTVDEKQTTYDAPSNANHVAFYVKPISETKKVNDEDVSYWTADWSTVVRHYFVDNPPSTPPVPTVEIKDYVLTATLDNLDVNATYIQFQVVVDNDSVYVTGKAAISTNHASYAHSVWAGHEYKVRCRSIRDSMYSEYSEYSANVGTQPEASEGIYKLYALSETSVNVNWYDVENADSYEIEYTTKKRYFDSSNEVQSLTIESVVGHAEITGLETGEEWFFRVRAVNDNGKSDWTDIESIVLGKAPSAPTTWSSTTTAIVGEALNLYWIHNAEDGSSQTYAKLELTVNGTTTTQTIQNSTDEDEKDLTSVYAFSTSGYTEGTTLKWRVKTRGITSDYSDWSIQRTVNIYASPTLSMTLKDSSGAVLDTLTSFPFYVSGSAGPSTQSPIGYYVSITSNETYETVDYTGTTKTVNSGAQVYSKYFDVTTSLLVEFSANNVDLANNITYTVTCTASMNSGLTAETSSEFTVAWTETDYQPNAEIGYDADTHTAFIKPHCQDMYGSLVENITLSVYRREFDGTFTEIATGLDNTKETYVTDPHPSLDYARYRVVAIDDDTGSVSYYDVPGYPVGEKAIIIQWDEEWSNFDTASEDVLEQPSWTGSLLKLPYNIDISDQHNLDVSLVEYVGRKYPVSYYGTQLGISSSWGVEIAKDDKDTLYALRRLAIWMGDVYVREPSGSGYWANVSVSFSQTHCQITIPVTLDITRVEGGV